MPREPSLSETTASLLTKPSLTDMLSNFPIWRNVDNAAPTEGSRNTFQLSQQSAYGHRNIRRGRICQDTLHSRHYPIRTLLLLEHVVKDQHQSVREEALLVIQNLPIDQAIENARIESASSDTEATAPNAQISTDPEPPSTAPTVNEELLDIDVELVDYAIVCVCIMKISSKNQTEPRGVNLSQRTTQCLVRQLVIRAEKTYIRWSRTTNQISPRALCNGNVYV